MKNLSPILNAVLLIAVAVLFFLHFSSGSQVASTENDSTAIDTTAAPAAVKLHTPDSAGALRIAIVNMDTIQEKLQIMKDLSAKLKAKENAAVSKINARESALKAEMMEFEQKMQSGMLTQIEGQAQYTSLEERGAKLQQLRAEEEQNLYEMQDELMKELREAIEGFLRRYNDEHGYELIFRHGTVSEILQHDGATDITSDVVSGLNAEYAASKSTPKAAK